MATKKFLSIQKDIVDLDGFPVTRGTVLTMQSVLPFGVSTKEGITIKKSDYENKEFVHVLKEGKIKEDQSTQSIPKMERINIPKIPTIEIEPVIKKHVVKPEVKQLPAPDQRRQMTREEAMNYAYKYFIVPLFKEKADLEVSDNVLISTAFPFSSGAIGECWQEQAGNGKFYIFIHPMYNNEEFSRVIDILVHEAIHTKVRGHMKDFSQPAKAVGLASPWTATTATPELKAEIDQFIKDHNLEYHNTGLGRIPKGFDFNPKEEKKRMKEIKIERRSGGGKKQGTRMIKATCDECQMIIRTTRNWIDTTGLPECACGGKFMEG